MKGGDSSPLLTTGEATSGVLRPVMGSPVKRKYRFTGVSPEQGYKDDEGPGAPER